MSFERTSVIPETLLALQKVNLGYSGRTVLENVELDLVRGDYLGVVGPNGAGKSTLLLGLLGVLPTLAGRREGPPPGLRIGYVPQRGALDELFPLTVRDIVVMGWELYRKETPPFDKIEPVLESVNLAGLATRRFKELSGGQKQRVLIARALVLEPELLVLDEPTNGLDLPSEHAIMELSARIHREGRTVVLVTHQLNLVANYARKLALVGDRHVTTGATSELLAADRLSAMYGTKVRVAEVEGHRVIMADPEAHR